MPKPIKSAMDELPQSEAIHYLREHLPSVLIADPDLFNWMTGDLDDYRQSREVRDAFISQFGFAILDRGLSRGLAQFSPLIEVGAGTGYWSYELRKEGIEVVATDLAPGARYGFTRSWVDVEAIDGVSAVLKYPDHTLLMVWPDYNVPRSADVLKAYTGKTVIYVGEGDGGCTGCDEFHAILEERFEVLREVRLYRFHYMHDRAWIYERKP
jgi:hypothetical protein